MPDLSRDASTPSEPDLRRQPLERLRRRLDRGHPNYLLNLFTLLSTASAILILALVGTAVYWIYGSAMVRNAEATAVSVGHAIFDRERDILEHVAADGSVELRVDAADAARLDARMRGFLAPFGVHKIKVFDAQRTIIYSTDASLIGRVDEGNAVLARVLRDGIVYSEQEHKKTFIELGGRTVADASIVETYLPIVSDDRRVGAFELYVDITRTRAEVVYILGLSLSVLAAVLLGTMFSLYLPMRRGTRDLIRAHAHLHEMATRDHLTGIYNRRYLTDRVDQEFHRRERITAAPGESAEISFIMADIDHFKRINDRYGHGVGDQVLREVAQRMGDAVRDYDVMGRYGGEEFLVMLPHTDAAAARSVADRLLSAVNATPVPVDGAQALPVSVSVGVATASRDDQTSAATVARADAAMYRAKAEGRNRVCVDPSPASV